MGEITIDVVLKIAGVVIDAIKIIVDHINGRNGNDSARNPEEE